MQNRRITMQDIADACGLSRNTVSKAFNAHDSVPQATKDLIFQKARELGYGAPTVHQFIPDTTADATIALFTSHLPSDYHFGTYFVTSFTNQISRAGYTLKLFEISADELNQKRLPPRFMTSQTAGIVGIELFDSDYINRICSLNLPTILIDSPAHAYEQLQQCDYVTMENTSSIISIVKHLYKCGARRIGFMGDIEHCGSFNERWIGFNYGLHAVNLVCEKDCCILDSDSSPYRNTDWMIDRLKRIPILPDAFVCANDYLAINLMTALKKMGISIPSGIMVTGFDGTAQSTLIEPSLTTVHIPSAEIGRIAANIMISRIQNPELPYFWTHVKTSPVWRGSTKCIEN